MPERGRAMDIAEIRTHQAHMSPFQFQRWVFRMAIERGWNGKEPSVLGHDMAEADFNDALAFIQMTDTRKSSKEI
jgi:hypothetical protein